MTFEDVLQQLQPEEMKDFLRHYRENSPDFEQRFLVFFSHKNPDSNVEKTTQQLVLQLFKQHSEKGYMNYSQLTDFCHDMTLVLQDAAAALARQHCQTAALMAQVICDELMELMESITDSDGQESMLVEDALEILLLVAKDPACSKDLRVYLLDWVEPRLYSSVWNNYGNHTEDLLSIASAAALLSHPQRFLRILDDFESAYRKSSTNSPFQEILVVKHVEFLLSLSKEEEALKIILDNQHIGGLRALQIERAVAQGAYTIAKELIGAEITRVDETNRFSSTQQWIQKLLAIAELEENLADQRKYAHHLAFSSGYANMQYYRYWKSLFDPQEWPQFLEQHIAEVLDKQADEGNRGNRGYHFRRLGEIYIEEERWDGLLQAGVASGDEDVLNRVLPYLGFRYPQEMLAAFLPVLQRMSHSSQKRSQYERLANRMIAVKTHIPGSWQAVDELALSVISLYDRRPAMLEEMRRALQYKSL